MRLKIYLIALLTLAIGVIYAVFIAPGWLRTTRLRIGIIGLDPQLQGMRIALLSDFHAGGEGVSWPMLWRARRIAEHYEPDLIALTGDYFDDGRFIASTGLFSDWPNGVPVVGVLGNHDWRSGEVSLTATITELENGGVQLLRNDSIAVEVRDTTIRIAGVDDPHLRRDDLSTALSCASDTDEFLLLLSHSPSIAEQIDPGQIQLILAGHTHGGQVRLLPSGKIPLINLIRRLRGLTAKPDPTYFRGNHWVGGAVLVISDGLGLSTIRARFRTRPQVVLIELESTQSHGRDCDDVRRYVQDMSDEPSVLRWIF